MSPKLSLLLFLVFITFSCQSDKKQDVEIHQNEIVGDTVSNVDSAHNSKNSLDWAGLYVGEFPCADCPGIEVSIKLNKDKTYKMIYFYKERNTSIKEKGSFKWNKDGSDITLFMNDSTTSGNYKVGENKLIKLDADKNLIKGKMADKFVLHKNKN